MDQSIYLGVDIGGSHMAISAIDRSTLQWMGKVHRTSIHPSLCADDFMHQFKILTNACMLECGEVDLSAICLALPGPFDYEGGIARYDGQNRKFENLFALDLPNTIRSFLGKADLPVFCINDAMAFGLGAAHPLLTENQTALAITLGTGLGSSFIQHGKPIKDAFGCIPANGELYRQPFKSSFAENYFSSSALIEKYAHLTGVYVSGVKHIAELAAQKEKAALKLFQDLGIELAEFLGYWVEQAELDIIYLGGSISGAWSYFYPALRTTLDQFGRPCLIERVTDTERTSIQGSVLAYLEHQRTQPERTWKRVTTESLMPSKVNPAPRYKAGYSIYPTTKLPDMVIHSDLTALLLEVDRTGCIRVDGYQGVDWSFFIQQSNRIFTTLGITCKWYSMDAAFLPNINELIAESLGPEDSIFGKISTLSLNDLFDPTALARMKSVLEGRSIVYGSGASILALDCPLVYIDMPKNEIQFRMRAGGVKQLGDQSKSISAAAAYKHSYFVTWPILNRHKSATIQQWDYVVDGQQEDSFNWMTGIHYRYSLLMIAQQPFRARPWFEPGVWGGKWMQQHIEGLNKEAINYAWSFELITPENGLIMEANGLLFETSFDSILYCEGERILGRDYAIFGHHFPIRFDFLDTIQGEHLSIQCHPTPTYMQEQFGEPFTQDETYYILDCEADAKVYLGFQEDIDPDECRRTLEESSMSGKEVLIDTYVQSFPSTKHDLFLIPHGTIHGSGKGNLVLEISSTPYIFTFKLYDWIRMGLDGKPRPINLDHGFKNLDFTRKGAVVKRDLISVPKLLEKGSDWKRFELPTHEKHFYAIHRFHFQNQVHIPKRNRCHIAMLVQGSAVTIHNPNTDTKTYHYAETFIIPASVDQYDVVNQGKEEAILIIAFVKEGLQALP